MCSLMRRSVGKCMVNVDQRVKVRVGEKQCV